MSRENVELIRRAASAFNRHDVAALTAMSHEDFVFVSSMAQVDVNEGSFQGAAAWWDYVDAVAEAWSDWRIEDVEIFDTGGDRLATVVRWVGTGRGSDVHVEQPMGIAYRIRDGKLWRMRVYPDPDEALEAVGLRK